MTDSEDLRVSRDYDKFDGRTTKLIVKSDSEEDGDASFDIPPAMLKGRSTYFKNALKSNPKTCTIKHCRPWYFAIYLQYLCGGFIACAHRNEEGDEDYESQWRNLVRVFLISEKLGDSGTMDASMNALLHLWKDEDSAYPPAWLIHEIYSEAKPDSKLKCFVVDVHRWGIPEDLKTTELPPQFLADLSLAFIKEKRESSDSIELIPEDVGCCDYHQHDASDKTCPNRKRKRSEADDDSTSE